MQMKDVIRRKRRECGLTQEQVAERLGVSTPAVNKWENGTTCPDISLLAPLARLLRTDINTLLCFQEDLTEENVVEYTTQITKAGKSERVSVLCQIIVSDGGCVDRASDLTAVYRGADTKEQCLCD